MNQSFTFPRVSAHKGLVSKNFPGNTLEAIRETLLTPVEGLELDVRLTVDKIPVLFHAETLDETTNGHGRVEDTFYGDLKNLTYKNSTYKIATLEDALNLIGEQKKLFLDIKESEIKDVGFAKIISEKIETHQLYESVIVESFNPIFLAYLRLRNRAVIIMYDFADDTIAMGEEVQTQLDKIPWILKQEFVRKQIRRILRPDILGPRWSIDGAILKNLSQNGYPLISWTVDDEGLAGRLMALGVDGIQSNKPLELMTSLKSGPILVTDAGGSRTTVDRRIFITSEEDVVQAFELAKKENKKISIAGRRHSMGGQSSGKATINLDMLGFNQVSYDPKTQSVRVQAGASWKKVQAELDKHNRSVQIMQSDNIFSVGGSISVNVHGWQVGKPPLGESIYQIRLLTPAGVIKTVSAKNDPDIFRAVIGGYGQFGIILLVDLQTLPNSILKMSSLYMPSTDFEKNFETIVSKNENVELAYGRLSVAHSNFLEQAGLFWFEKSMTADTPLLEQERLVAFKRAIFRLSEVSDFGKELRWKAEKTFAQNHDGNMQTRNSIMNPDIHVLWPTRKGYQDILQEYFIPKGKVNDFIPLLRTRLLTHDMNILNITIREVREDKISLLPYARTDCFAFVLLFSQKTDTAEEQKMKNFTMEMINAATSLEGSFYLPYRTHYTGRLLQKAYPSIQDWVAEKRRMDPEGRLTSQFWEYISEITTNL